MAYLFYNLHGILYGNQIPQYFDCHINLEDLHYCSNFVAEPGTNAAISSAAITSTDIVIETELDLDDHIMPYNSEY